MEVVTASPGNGTPFHNHDVREWSRLDSLTGVLERARLETDHWTAKTGTSSHKYNKVVDSRARSGADGSLQQAARRKLEVFQSQVPGGRLQVIKTQTVSSSRWTNCSPATSDGKDSRDSDEGSGFDHLKLVVNPLDFTSEKSKASVGRGVGRRPPSRSLRVRDLQTTAQTNLHRVSRLCHQVHSNAVRCAFGDYEERGSADGVEINEVEDGHGRLSRTKSTSSEELDVRDVVDDVELQNWRRTSKLRRSLQYPKLQKGGSGNKPPDLPECSGSVKRIKEDLEKGRRLSAALRGNNVDLDALDQILKSISRTSALDSPSSQEETEEKKKVKRDSFVTVESIQAVRDRLRRTSSPGLDVYAETTKEPEETDDGIVTEQSSDMAETYLYGMKNISGTGSLESRIKASSVMSSKNDDWFNRRKSYGFEQMHSQEESIKHKGKIESSTDSGICRSSEIVLVPAATRCSSDDDGEKNVSIVKKYANIFEKKTKGDEFVSWSKRVNKNKDVEATTITIPISSSPTEVKRHSIAVDESKYMNKQESSFKRTSLAINNNDKYTEDDNKRQNKKVEFCKTEVHFAADSGKVNIVETDEKPPPTQNFRRRRRNSGITEEFINKSNLPVIHFGDTPYEKQLFNDPMEDTKTEAVYENVPTVTVNANSSNRTFTHEIQEQNEAPRGILKNKPIKPKPYILGENDMSDGERDDKNTWGVKLRSAQKDEQQSMWNQVEFGTKSSVKVNNESEPEFQKLLKQLRPTYRRLSDAQFDESGFSSSPDVINVKHPSNIEEEDGFDRQVTNSRYADLSNVSFRKLSDDSETYNKYSNDFSNTKLVSANYDYTNGIEEDNEYSKENKNVKLSEVIQSNRYSDDFSSTNIMDYRNNHNERVSPENYDNFNPAYKIPSNNHKLNSQNTNGNKYESRNHSIAQRSNNVVSTKPNVLLRDTFSSRQTENIVLNESAKLGSPDDYSSPTESNVTHTYKKLSEEAQKNRFSSTKITTLSPTLAKKQLGERSTYKKSISYNPPPITEVKLRSTYNRKSHNDDTKRYSADYARLSTENQQNKRYSEDITNMRYETPSPSIDTRRSSWSVADRIKQVEDLHWMENKGYSTKVNFNEGEATVVENRHPTWPRKDELPNKDLKRNLLNKGLVVRIGREDTSKHTVCSKTTSDDQGATTTTKITIDLTPSPTEDSDTFTFPSNKIRMHSFKSPSLIINTFKNESSDTFSNSAFAKHESNRTYTFNGMRDVKKTNFQLEALKKLYDEVCSDSEADKEVLRIMNRDEAREDTSSVVSGSWSKMRAFKQINQFNRKDESHALSEKEQRKLESEERFQMINNQIENDLKQLKLDEEQLNSKYSPVAVRKTARSTVRTNIEKLSSPYLVGQNHSKTSPSNSDVEKLDKKVKKEIIIRNRSPGKEKVLRQPKKSELAYFGVKVSPQPNKKEPTTLTNKPDLLQFSPVSSKKTATKVSKVSPVKTSPKVIQSPIYENLRSTKATKNKFDSKILEELTKAADQILQAVNGYTDEELHNKYNSSDDEDIHKPLETISETKVYKTSSSTHSTVTKSKHTKLKATSSNSSIDESPRKNHQHTTKSSEQKQQPKKVSSMESAAKAKARRLQRASSREALLQSHGSSSEDLAVNTDMIVRKPRLVKKTKVAQLTISNGMELKKPARRKDERTLPEIRHKTAVSTIRSTAEKAASREKTRKDESKRRQTNKGTSPLKQTQTADQQTVGVGGSGGRTSRTVAGRGSAPHHHSSVSNHKKSMATTTISSTTSKA